MPDLVDFAERPRVGGWSLRSALVRFAQPAPAGAGAILELVRRTDGALRPHLERIEHDPTLEAVAREAASGDEALDAVERAVGASDRRDDDKAVIGLLVVAVHLDRLGDVLATWACDIGRPRPDAEVDSLARRAFDLLSRLGVEREQRHPARRA